MAWRVVCDSTPEMKKHTMPLTLASCSAIAVGLLATSAPSQYRPFSHCTGVKKVGAALVALTAVTVLILKAPGYRLLCPGG